METYGIFYDMATVIVDQIKEMSKMLENNDDLREYINIYTDRCFTAEYDPLTITVHFVEDRLYRPLLEG